MWCTPCQRRDARRKHHGRSACDGSGHEQNNQGDVERADVTDQVFVERPIDPYVRLFWAAKTE